MECGGVSAESDYVRKGRLPSNWRDHVMAEGGPTLGPVLDSLLVIVRSGKLTPSATTSLLRWLEEMFISVGVDVMYWPKNNGAFLKTFGYSAFVNRRYCVVICGNVILSCRC
jgi:hypothetical protein